MSPKYREFLNFTIFFYSREENEPIHVHVAQTGSHGNSSKFWIRPNGVELAHNQARIPDHQLKRIEMFLAANADDIIAFWNKHFS